VQPAVDVVAAEMETVLYAQMLALFAPQVVTGTQHPEHPTPALTCHALITGWSRLLDSLRSWASCGRATTPCNDDSRVKTRCKSGKWAPHDAGRARGSARAAAAGNAGVSSAGAAARCS
jgi:hypothetical protein